MTRSIRATRYDLASLAFLLMGLLMLTGIALRQPSLQASAPEAGDPVFLR